MSDRDADDTDPRFKDWRNFLPREAAPGRTIAPIWIVGLFFLLHFGCLSFFFVYDVRRHDASQADRDRIHEDDKLGKRERLDIVGRLDRIEARLASPPK